MPTIRTHITRMDMHPTDTGRLSLASLGFETRHVGAVLTMDFSPDGGKQRRRRQTTQT